MKWPLTCEHSSLLHENKRNWWEKEVRATEKRRHWEAKDGDSHLGSATTWYKSLYVFFFSNIWNLLSNWFPYFTQCSSQILLPFSKTAWDRRSQCHRNEREQECFLWESVLFQHKFYAFMWGDDYDVSNEKAFLGLDFKCDSWDSTDRYTQTYNSFAESPAYHC